jgi:hypothetical protein
VLATTLPEPEHLVHASDVLVYVVITVVAMLAIVLAYHAMQRPRLVVSEIEPGVWRSKRRDVVKYAVSIPLLLILWLAGLQLILVFANNGLSGVQLSVISVALVISVRIFAHVSHEHAHELAKTVPLTVVTLFIISSNGMRNPRELDQTIADWNATALSGPTELLLIGTEFVIAALWYWVGVRWWWPRGHDLIGMPKHRHLAEIATASPTPPAVAEPVTRTDQDGEPAER